MVYTTWSFHYTINFLEHAHLKLYSESPLTADAYGVTFFFFFFFLLLWVA